MVNAADMSACIFNVLTGYLFVHGNNDLFTERALGSHINMRLRFVLTAVDDFMDLINLVVLKFREYLFNLESVYHHIRVLRFERSLSI